MTIIIAKDKTKENLTPVVKKLIDKVDQISLENIPEDKKVYWVDVKRTYPEIAEKIKFLFKGRDSISIGDLKKEMIDQRDELFWLSEDIWDEDLQAELYDVCEESQKVLQLNLNADLISKIKQDKIFDSFFSNFSRLMGGSRHPTHTQTIAWIRYYKFPAFWVVEEIQSDLFGKSTKINDMTGSTIEDMLEEFSDEEKQHLEDFFTENFKDWDMKLLSSLISLARKEGIKDIWIFDEDVKESTGLSMSKKNRFYKEVPRNLGFKRDVLKVKDRSFTAWKRAIASSTFIIPALKKVIEADFKTVEKKFLVQLGDTPENRELVQNYLKRFKQLRDQNRIQMQVNRDIETWGKKGFNAFKELVDDISERKSKSQMKKTIHKEAHDIDGADLVAENDDWIVYKINDYEACKLLGSRNWCIVRDESTFENYTKEDELSNFYFILAKDRPEDEWHKIALQVDSEDVTYWDALDKSHSHYRLPEEVKETIPKFTVEYPPKICGICGGDPESCYCCNSCENTQDNCTCCPVCDSTNRHECGCCTNCESTADDCNCCNICGDTNKDECGCCQGCEKRESRCNCCSECGDYNKDTCGCWCDECEHLLDDCTCEEESEEIKKSESHLATGILTQRFREETGKKEWALVSKKKSKGGKRRVLYWFGAKKPSDESVAKQEKRVQYWKHKG